MQEVMDTMRGWKDWFTNDLSDDSSCKPDPICNIYDF